MSYAFGGVYYIDMPAWNATWLLRTDVTHKDEYFTTANNDTEVPYNSAFPGTIPFGQIDSRTEVNARLGLMSDNDTWQVSAWGRNLTDEDSPQDELRDFFGTIAKLPSMPRTYGVELVWNF